jgi:predicted HNH restriction endonuclease
MRQVVGRGLRSPDAICAIYILDERYQKLGNFLPDRFSKCWVEGGRQQITLSVAERDPAIRKAALKHYGMKCYACDFVPPHSSIIDIHHRNPIAEGERKTTLEDVIPLCANCHRRAHTRTPPIALEQLRDLVSDKNLAGSN